MIDIGLNLTNRQFVHDQEELLYRAEEAGVTQMILTGTSLRSSKESFALAKGHPTLLYSTAGVHPHDAKTMNEQTIPQLSTLLKENLGVDYKTEKQRKQEKAKNEAQKNKDETKTEARKVRNERTR